MDIFGDYDESSASVPTPTPGKQINRSTSIPGLWIIEELLSNEGAETALCHSLAAGWGTDSVNNQAMMFGEMPIWVNELEDVIRQSVSKNNIPFKVHKYNQLILNRYTGEEGLVPHVDLAKFEDYIVGVTLCGTATFVFTPLSGGSPTSFFLKQGDAYLMSGNARYNYTHGIPESEYDVDDHGNQIPRTMRVSITLRKLVEDE